MAGTAVFVGDDELGYADRGRPRHGQAWHLDEAYRVCHLPLVAPEHPDVLPTGENYVRGRRDEVVSLVAPIDAGSLEASPSWRAMDSELRASPLAGKIAWDIAAQRRMKLHATLSGRLDFSLLREGWRARLAEIAPFRTRLTGVMVGLVNTGRIYLRLYPERCEGINAIHAVQDALGRPRTGRYLVGVHNLTDHLEPAEAGWLADWLARWADAPLIEQGFDRLALMSSSDDLVLEGGVVESLLLRQA